MKKLRSAQNEIKLGSSTISAGRFDFGWKPTKTHVGAGNWTVVASDGCAKETTPIKIKK